MNEDSFVNDIMSSLPRLVPIWHDFTFQEKMKCQSTKRFSKEKLPDFGGMGNDIVFEENAFKCKETKVPTNNSSYAAVTCALPFLPAIEVSEQSDPCLAPLREAQLNARKFSCSLETCRQLLKCKKNEIYKKQVESLNKKIRKMNLKNEFKKITVPESVLRLATNFPGKTLPPPINMSYAGGCLAVSQRKGENYMLLHPVGKKLNRLGITFIEETDDSIKHFKPISIEDNSIKLKRGPILQISKAIDGYCFVRQKRSCHVVDFNDVTNISSTKIIKNEVMSISASPYNPFDYVVIYPQGNLELNNTELNNPIWILNERNFRYPFEVFNTVQCSFGSHPQSIFCLSENYFDSFDVRFKDNRRRTLFSNDYLCCTFEEKFTCFKSCALGSFQHVISSAYHMFVCDERYPRRPLLVYNHMMKGHPLYIDKAILKSSENISDIMILLAAQDTNQTSSFLIRADNILIQPVSLVPPMHVSVPKDSGETLKLHGIPVHDTLMERLSYPLVGIGVLPHSQASGFTVLQLNSAGDLFHQDFTENPLSDSEKSRKVEIGCVLTPAEIIQPHLDNFLPVKENQADPVEFTHPQSVELNVNLLGIFDAMKNIPEYCKICNPNIKRPPNYEDQIHVCLSCGFDDEQSQNLNNASENVTLLSGPVKQVPSLTEFDTTPFYEFKDSLSKKLLEAWNFTVSNDSSNETVCHDSDLSFATSTPQMSVSSPSSLLEVSSMDESSKSSFAEVKEDLAKKLFGDISFIGPADLPMSQNQELMEEFVPPSQEVRPLLGETLRTPKKSKRSFKSSQSGSAGFL